MAKPPASEVKGSGYVRETLAGGPWEYGLVSSRGGDVSLKASSRGALVGSWRFTRIGEAPSRTDAWGALKIWWSKAPDRIVTKRKVRR